MAVSVCELGSITSETKDAIGARGHLDWHNADGGERSPILSKRSSLSLPFASRFDDVVGPTMNACVVRAGR
jgi:hypothetical protein